MRQTRLAAALAMSLVLGACASTGAVRHRAQANPNDDFDAGKVATVTQWAERRGATVVWIHYPTKHRAGNDDGG